jgi:RNA polymerase sigma-70 factor (ECF subfamily)
MIDLDRLCRAEWGRLLAALIRSFGDFDLAEEALQEAFAAAAEEWTAAAPENHRGWLYATARHRALDRLRRDRILAGKLAELAQEPQGDPAAVDSVDSFLDLAVPDERLHLIFTCCHPALPFEAQVALTLRTVGGLTTEEIARAFLLPSVTMAQRLVRAKAKIREAGIPYSVPGEGELADRTDAVMNVLYLIFNEGYAAAQGEALIRRDLCAEAIRLARLLCALLQPAPSEALALLALMLLVDSRRDARTDADGDLILLPEQDRARWDRAAIAEGLALVERALRFGAAGPYALEAAIAAVHAEAATAAETDWSQIAALYGRLLEVNPSAVTALNHAVAVAMAEGPAAGLARIEALSEPLGDYHLWHAARADLLRRLGRRAEATASYRSAHALARNEAERRFLARRIAETEA